MLLMSLIIVAKFILKDIFVLGAEVILLLHAMPGPRDLQFACF